MKSRSIQYFNITSLFVELINYPTVKTLTHWPTLEKQKGESCKIVAITNTLNFHYLHGNIHKKPRPSYKRKDPAVPCSAREIAKLVAKSVVGELYTEKMLVDLVKGLGEATNDDAVIQADIKLKRFSTAENESEINAYIQFLQNNIDNDVCSIIFFDAENQEQSRIGGPRLNGNGDNEHAAIVLGYHMDNDENVFFILGHWGKYFIVNGKELAISAGNLATYREPEMFYKIKSKYYSDTWRTDLANLPYEIQDEIYANETEADQEILEFQLNNEKNNKKLFLTIYRKKGYQLEDHELGLQGAICTIYPKKDLYQAPEEKEITANNSNLIYMQTPKSTEEFSLKEAMSSSRLFRFWSPSARDSALQEEAADELKRKLNV